MLPLAQQQLLFLKQPRKDQAFNGARAVLQPDKRHGAAVFGGFLFHVLHKPEQPDAGAVAVAALCFRCQQQIAHPVGVHTRRKVIICRHRVSGQIQSGDRLLVVQHRLARQFIHSGRGRFVLRGKKRPFVKEADLPRHVVARVGFQLRNDNGQHIDHLAAVQIQTVQRAAADQAFHGTFVELPAARAFAKVIERAEL